MQNPPKIFGTEHIIYIVLSFAVTIAILTVVGIFCKTEKLKKIVIKTGGGILLFLILLNRVFCIQHWTDVTYLPTSICGTISLFFGAALILCKKDSFVLHFLTYTALFTGLLPTIYPDYLGQGPTIFFPATITSLLHHSVCFMMAIMVLELKYITPNIKKWYAWPLGYCVLVFYGLFNIKILNQTDSININSPILPNTPLNFFYIGLMFFALYIIFLFIYDSIVNKKDCVLAKCYRKIVSLFKKKKELDENGVVEISKKIILDKKFYNK